MSASARTLPKIIRVTQYLDRWSLEIDGNEFPWYIGADGIGMTVDTNGIPGVTLTIPATQVVAVHSLERAPKPADLGTPIFDTLTAARAA